MQEYKLRRMGKNFYFATWLRVCAVFIILLRHFTQFSGIPWLTTISEIFNVGNSVFFILSGFLIAGRGGISGSTLSWYGKRAKRIYFPYEMMLIALLGISLIMGQKIELSKWIPQFLGIQGWNTVYGAGQTWFITSILLCYLITPVLSKVIDRLKEEPGKLIIIGVIIVITPIGIDLSIDNSSIINPIFLYSISMIVSSQFSRFHLTKREALYAVTIGSVSCLLRLIARHYFDGTIFYNKIVSGYTSMILAFSIFWFFAVLFNNVKPLKCVEFISKISFEIYLWHMMFVSGPLSLMNVTAIWVLNCLLVLVVSTVVAACMNYVSLLVVRRK